MTLVWKTSFSSSLAFVDLTIVNINIFITNTQDELLDNIFCWPDSTQNGLSGLALIGQQSLYEITGTSFVDMNF